MDFGNASRIDEYILEHPDCILKSFEPVQLEGKRNDLQVYRLPISFLRYNIKNGRFAAEYFELRQRENRELDSRNPSDALTLRNLLLKIDENATSSLIADIKQFGQKHPGIITFDGYLINGNRRMAVHQFLYEETFSERWAFLEVARLPSKVRSVDLWKIEAGLQIGMPERLEYGPMNTLLKFQEGIDSGLTPAQIANSLFGNFTETSIKESLERLKLIERYLEFIREPYHYSIIEKRGIHEHFIELQKILNNERRQGAPIRELVRITNFIYELITKGIPYRDLRGMTSVLKNDLARNKILQAQLSTGIQTIEKPDIQTSVEAKLDDVSAVEKDGSIIKELFLEARDIAEATEHRDKPIKLLRKALTDLQAIDEGNSQLQEAESQDLLRQIIFVAEKLQNLRSNDD